MTEFSASSAQPEPADHQGPHWIAYLVAMVFFMENLDATVITTVLPQMAAVFSILPPQLSVGVSAYMLALAIFIPLSGWLADQFGPRSIFSLAVIVFTAASVLCGLADSLGIFVFARVLQGMGGAMMVPVGRLVVLRSTPKHQLVNAIALITWPGLIAPVIGPLAGAVIAAHFGWRWIFFLNLPLGLVALVCARRLLPPGGIQRRPFDVVGFILLAIGCGGAMTALELASEHIVPGWIELIILILAVAALWIAFVYMRRISHPMINPDVLGVKTFRVVIAGGSLFRTAVSSAPFLLPLMFQLGFGWSAVQSGWMLMALFAGNVSMKPWTTRLLKRYGFKRILVVNGMITAAGFAACALFQQNTPVPLMVLVLYACGLSRSMQYTAMNTIGFSELPTASMNGATTLFSMGQQMNIGMGVAFGALGLSIGSALQAGGYLAAEDVLARFHVGLWMVAILAMFAVIDSLGLAPAAGSTVSGHNPQSRTGQGGLK